MRKLFLAVPLLIFSSGLYAEPAPEVKIMRKPTLCFELDYLLNNLRAEHGESLTRKFGKVEIFDTEAMLWENSEKGSWTIIEYKDNVGCIIATGKGDKKA